MTYTDDDHNTRGRKSWPKTQTANASLVSPADLGQSDQEPDTKPELLQSNQLSDELAQLLKRNIEEFDHHFKTEGDL